MTYSYDHLFFSGIVFSTKYPTTHGRLFGFTPPPNLLGTPHCRLSSPPPHPFRISTDLPLSGYGYFLKLQFGGGAGEESSVAVDSATNIHDLSTELTFEVVRGLGFGKSL